MHKASRLSLLSNAALGWNTMHMPRFLKQRRAAGETVTDAELARVAPLALAHLIPHGTYCTRPTPLENPGEPNGHFSLLEMASDV
jgi:hypothetical protein